MRCIRIGAVLLCFSAAAGAHVTIWPKTSALGAREKYEVRVPNERQSDTIAVEVRSPTGVRITSIEQKPEWRTEALRDASGQLVGARWTGKLGPEQFTEFGLLAVNPAQGGEVAWTAVQIYADGTRVEWSGPAGSKTPAPRVTLTPSAR
jgi:uncharacterized protein YcnI